MPGTPAALVTAHSAVVADMVTEFVAPLGVSAAWTAGLIDLVGLAYRHGYKIASMRAVRTAITDYGIEADSGLTGTAPALRLTQAIHDGIELAELSPLL